MNRQQTIDRLHESMNDIFVNVHSINVRDESSRKAREIAVLKIGVVRRQLDWLGLYHSAQKYHQPVTSDAE